MAKLQRAFERPGAEQVIEKLSPWYLQTELIVDLPRSLPTQTKKRTLQILFHQMFLMRLGHRQTTVLLHLVKRGSFYFLDHYN